MNTAFCVCNMGLEFNCLYPGACQCIYVRMGNPQTSIMCLCYLCNYIHEMFCENFVAKIENGSVLLKCQFAVVDRHFNKIISFLDFLYSRIHNHNRNRNHSRNRIHSHNPCHNHTHSR